MGNFQAKNTDSAEEAVGGDAKAVKLLHTYEPILSSVVRAVETKIISLIVAAFQNLFYALCDDMCVIQAHPGTSRRPTRADHDVFSKQLVLRAIILNGSQRHAPDTDVRGVLALARLGKSWSASNMRSLRFVDIAQRCLSTTLFGPRVHSLVVRIMLLLLGYDSNHGDILGPATTSTRLGMKIDLGLVANWNRSRVGADSTEPLIPTVFLPSPQYCKDQTLKMALREQCFTHRRIVGVETTFLQTVLGAYFKPETDTRLRLM